ncbi:MAG: GIY-YIG nuclease family protein [Bacteroidota bacterium]
MYLVYILQSLKSGKYYVGHTDDLPYRFTQHNNGYSKSTKSGIPWKIVHTEPFSTRSDAMKREHEIKSKKSRTYIEKLMRDDK